jgi:hypothetical protein
MACTLAQGSSCTSRAQNHRAALVSTAASVQNSVVWASCASRSRASQQWKNCSWPHAWQHEARLQPRKRSVTCSSSEIVPLGHDFLKFLGAFVFITPLFKRINVSPILGFLLAGVVLRQCKCVPPPPSQVHALTPRQHPTTARLFTSASHRPPHHSLETPAPTPPLKLPCVAPESPAPQRRCRLHPAHVQGTD